MAQEKLSDYLEKRAPKGEEAEALIDSFGSDRERGLQELSRLQALETNAYYLQGCFPHTVDFTDLPATRDGLLLALEAGGRKSRVAASLIKGATEVPPPADRTIFPNTQTLKDALGDRVADYDTFSVELGMPEEDIRAAHDRLLKRDQGFAMMREHLPADHHPTGTCVNLTQLIQFTKDAIAVASGELDPKKALDTWMILAREKCGLCLSTDCEDREVVTIGGATGEA